MNRYLNMVESTHNHVKAEAEFIHSMSKDEEVEILYATDEIAEKKIKTLAGKVRGTADSVQFRRKGNVIFVTHKKNKEVGGNGK